MSAATDLSGRVAIVTGGSGGIGAATARILAEQGATVVITYKGRVEHAQAVVAGLAGGGHRALRLVLEDAGTIAQLVRDVDDAYGRADILVNSAGFTVPIAHNDLDALTDELFDAILQTNVRGPFAMIRALAPLLRAGGDGVVVNVSSISAFTGSGSSMAYCASKAALDTMTLSLGRALGPAIRVLCVSPGAVATDFVAGRDRAALERIAQGTPLRRVVEPEDVAWAIAACVTHLRLSTGGRVVVDGGRFLV